MPFSENQLNTWANQGAMVSSVNTYNSIKTCIEGNNWNNDIYYSIYLQGSYRNSTNIIGDSDVDVVVEFSSTFHSNIHELPPEQLKEYNEYFPNSKYTLGSFTTAIVERLKHYYGDAYVKVGNKSIKVLGNSGRLDCDVICCAEYREFKSFSKTNTNDCVKGIVFWTTNTKEKVVNFPKSHYDNGIEKNKNCSTNYKPSIRIIKNMKSRMTDKGLLISSLAPSYFIECLMYNVTNNNYCHDKYHDIIVALLTTFYNYSDSELNKFVCQNYRRCLFGSTSQQWNIDNCKKFISEIIKFWNNG